jgi:hypothetical protein
VSRYSVSEKPAATGQEGRRLAAIAARLDTRAGVAAVASFADRLVDIPTSGVARSVGAGDDYRR